MEENLIENSFDVTFLIYSPDLGFPILTLPRSPYHCFIPCEELLQDIPGFLRTNLSEFLSNNQLQRITPGLISQIQSRVHNYHYFQLIARPQLIPLIIDVQLPSRYEEDEDIEQSMEQVVTIPPSKEAIASLKKIEETSEKAKIERCCICLENFEENDDVSGMPCDHIYHKNCIVEWMKISHTCPLCRFQMPTK